MNVIILLFPTFILLSLGYILKRYNVFDASFGRSLLKFVFLVTMPALVLRSISELHLDATLFVFLLLPLVLTAVSFIIIKPLEKNIKLKPKQFAIFLMATMAINSGFTLPFVVSIYGDAGAARVALFNVMNNVMVFGWVYAVAIKYGEKGHLGWGDLIKKVTLTPVFIFLIIAFAMNIFSVGIPSQFSPTINVLADLTGPIILLALGLIFEPKLIYPLQTFQSLFVRMIGGLIIGIIFVNAFGLSGVDRAAVLLLSASPVGFNTVTFSSMEKLDDEFAASIVAMGLIAGLIMSTVLTLILG